MNIKENIIAPTHSAAGSLRVALKEFGINNQIIPCPDFFNIGPIGAGLFQEKETLLGEIYSTNIYKDVFPIEEQLREIKLFWDQVTSLEKMTIIWSSKSAHDHVLVGLVLEYMRDKSEISLLDVNQYLEYKDIISVGELSPDQIKNILEISQDDLTESLPLELSDNSNSLPLVVLEKNSLAYVDWDFIDTVIIQQFADEPVLAARIVGDILATLSESYNQVSDALVWYRLDSLLKSKELYMPDMTLQRDSQISLIN